LGTAIKSKDLGINSNKTNRANLVLGRKKKSFVPLPMGRSSSHHKKRGTRIYVKNTAGGGE